MALGGAFPLLGIPAFTGAGGGGPTPLEAEIIENIEFTELARYGDTVEAEATDAITIFRDLLSSNGIAALVSDDLEIEDLLSSLPGAVINQTVGISEVVAPNGVYHLALVDEVEIAELLLAGIPADLADTLNVAELLTGVLGTALIDSLGLADFATPNALYGVTLVQALTVRDALAQFFGADISEDLTISPTLAAALMGFPTISDNLTVSEELTPRLLLSVVVDEGVEVDPIIALRALYAPEIVEGITITPAYVSPGGTVTTWAMNARTGAVTEYDNYEFNSFARVGNKYLGASASGLYELLGDDDDGEDIIARLLSGFMQFGGTHLSRLKAAYLASRGECDFVLRIIDGDDVRYDYAVSTRNMRSTKVHMGKGQRSRYFSFELISDGGDFDIDTLEFVPIVVQRRV